MTLADYMTFADYMTLTDCMTLAAHQQANVALTAC